jgi:hypothetical protein
LLDVPLLALFVCNSTAVLGNVLYLDVFRRLASRRCHIATRIHELLALLISIHQLVHPLHFFSHLLELLHATYVIRLDLAFYMVQLRIFMPCLIDRTLKIFNLLFHRGNHLNCFLVFALLVFELTPKRVNFID